ncbi:hypothetical protein TNCV_4256301 [Trichonephila clavipes]|nr:hypothetical protein TNCV_4256301 [Trichonephila clavipes]
MSMTFWVSPGAEAAKFQKAWPSLQVINWVFSCEPQRCFGEVVVELKTQLLLGLTNSSSWVTNDGFCDVLVCSFKTVTSLSCVEHQSSAENDTCAGTSFSRIVLQPLHTTVFIKFLEVYSICYRRFRKLTEEDRSCKIVRVQYFVRGGFVGHRSHASSKHLSPHLPVDEIDSSGVKKGLRCRCKMHVWVSGPQRNRLDVDVFEK